MSDRHKDHNRELSDMYKDLNRDINREMSCSDFEEPEKDSGWPELSYESWRLMTVEKLKEYLVDDEEDVNERVSLDGYSALMFASVNNKDSSVIQHLIDQGANVSSCNDTGETALLLAVKHNRELSVVECLLENGADLEAEDSFGTTILLGALEENSDLVLAKFLIDKGAAVTNSHVDSFGDTTGGLNIFGRIIDTSDDEEVIQFLIDNGADPQEKDEDRNTALMVASKRSGNPKIVQLLLKFKCYFLGDAVGVDNCALVLAAKHSWSEEVLELLVDYAIKHNIIPEYGDLWWSASKGLSSNEHLKNSNVRWKINDMRYNRLAFRKDSQHVGDISQ